MGAHNGNKHNRMLIVLALLEHCHSLAVALVCTFLVLVITLTGLFFNNLHHLVLLNVFPLLIISWHSGKRYGYLLAVVIVSLTTIVSWQTAEAQTLHFSDAIYFTFQLAVYYFIIKLVLLFRDAHNQEFDLANLDHLTKLLNLRSFSIELANEILRSIRYEHTFSLSYIDIDNFKRINDTLGHQEGDKLLKTVAEILVSSLRETDVVARLGGDEFAIIFPETDQAAVKNAFTKASNALKMIMKENKWDVSFSVGIVTFKSLPKDIKEAIKIADQLMYTVKSNKKNNIAFQVWQEKV
ncbi:GGDEF domain-containing protein [Thalassotalea ganghwensis]